MEEIHRVLTVHQEIPVRLPRGEHHPSIPGDPTVDEQEFLGGVAPRHIRISDHSGNRVGTDPVVQFVEPASQPLSKRALHPISQGLSCRQTEDHLLVNHESEVHIQVGKGQAHQVILTPGPLGSW